MGSRMLTRDQFIRSLHNSTTTCAICLDAYDSSSHLAVRNPCGHWFGRCCLIASIAQSPSPNTCPICRDTMYPYRIEGPQRIGQPPDIFIADTSVGETWGEICNMEDSDAIAHIRLLWRSIRPYVLGSSSLLRIGEHPGEKPIEKLLLKVLKRIKRDARRDVRRNLNQNLPPGNNVVWACIRLPGLRDHSEFHWFFYNMAISSTAFQYASLPVISAKLWLKMARTWNNENTIQCPLTAMRFLMMMESMILAGATARGQVIPDGTKITHWNSTETLLANAPGFGFSNMDMKAKQAEIREELERQHVYQNHLTLPLYIGRDEELASVLEIFDFSARQRESSTGFPAWLNPMNWFSSL